MPTAPDHTDLQRRRSGAREHSRAFEVDAISGRINIDLRKQPVSAHSDMVQSKKADFALWIDYPIQPDPNYSLRLLI